ncbi:MAG: carbohydrate binding domain-containing protein [Thermoguttaceae bacterium]|nr:carbohydrate binding domain-containing protein [Thermoguttaceae bacterium]
MRTILFLLTVFFPLALHAGNTLFPFPVDGSGLRFLWTPPGGFTPAGDAGRVRIAGDVFVDGTGKTLRFWGVNLPFDSNFPQKADAARFALRLRSFGINVVRLHFVDTKIWGKYEKLGHRKMDEEKLDRLDWFIYQMKLVGIYVNINLHVGRTLDSRDGNFPEVEKLPNMQKGVDNYVPEMIELQKEYARDLLTHVNPYTKKAYTEDPCVAFVEINNENSIVCEWNCGHLEELPDFYAKMLWERWNSWLAERYKTTEELSKAWGVLDVPLGEEMIPDGGFTSVETFRNSPWNLEKDAEVEAQAWVDESTQTLKIDVKKASTKNWNPQFYLTKATIEEGVPYTISFRIRSSKPKKASFYFMEHHADYRNVRRTIQLEKDWQTVQMTILPTFSDSNVRLGFAQLDGEVEIDDFSVRRGGRIGPGKDELEHGPMSLVSARKEDVTPRQKRDFHDFLMDLDDLYWREMYAFLKDELKVQAPIAGTQLRYASTYAQAQMDYCDIHSYWCHPYWPGSRWDQNDWIVDNKPYVNAFMNGGNLAELAFCRVVGKPFTLSEYNHPWPNFYSAEGFPMAAAVGAFQNWSAVYAYAWSHREDHQDGLSYFDQTQNACQLVHLPACVNLFVRGDLRSVESLNDVPRVIKRMTREEEYAHAAERMNAYHRWFGWLGHENSDVIKVFCGVQLTDLMGMTLPASLIRKDGGSPSAAGPAANARPAETKKPQSSVSEEKIVSVKSPTDEIEWNGEDPERCWFRADTPRTKLFTGFLAPSDGESTQTRIDFRGGTALEISPTLLDWATVSLTQTDETHWLLAATGFMANTDGTFCEYGTDADQTQAPAELKGKRLTSPQRGKMPRLCEGVKITLTFPVPAEKTVTAWALDGDAKRKEPVPVRRISDSAVQIECRSQTLWYEIEVKGP